jgi:hypothetical protein
MKWLHQGGISVQSSPKRIFSLILFTNKKYIILQPANKQDPCLGGKNELDGEIGALFYSKVYFVCPLRK